jgi:hypothetical protein
MSDRCRHQPDSLLIEHAAIAALPAPHGPEFRAWVGDPRNPTVIDVGDFSELRKSGDQGQSTNVILLEQDADAASVPCSEPLPNEVDDEGVYATADIVRLDYDVSGGRAGFVSFVLPPLAGNDPPATITANDSVSAILALGTRDSAEPLPLGTGRDV